MGNRIVLGKVQDIFSFHSWWDSIGIWWVESRDAVKSPTVHRTAPTTYNDLAENVNSAKVVKP